MICFSFNIHIVSNIELIRGDARESSVSLLPFLHTHIQKYYHLINLHTKHDDHENNDDKDDEDDEEDADDDEDDEVNAEPDSWSPGHSR